MYYLNYQFQLKLFPLIAAAILCLPSAALSDPSRGGVPKLKEAIDKILDHSCLSNKNYGVQIFSLDHQETVYSHKSDQQFIPASNVKLVTTAVALKTLGPDYRFLTRLYSAGRVEGGVLHGDLYIKGFGDPKLVSEQMWLLVNEVANLPIRKIEGDIIADDSYFDRGLKINSRRGGGAQAYYAPIGALSFNFNTVTVYVKPGPHPGDKPVVVVVPDTYYIWVDNKAKTLPPGKKGRLIINRVDRENYDVITIKGGISQNEGRSRHFLSITDPANFTVNVFKDYLARAGIVVTGSVGLGKVPKKAKVIAYHESEPLALALRGLNKFSNNFVAEQILKTLAAEHFGPPGNTRNSLKIIAQYMKELGHAPESYKIVDGSGLSRKNRLTAAQLVSILKDMYLDLSVYPEFVSALGVMGLDGNVKRRMKGLDHAHRARVKTGTLNSISALSGYFQSLEGEMFAFSILMNDLKCSNRQALKLQDQVISEGLNFRRVKDGFKKPVRNRINFPGADAGP